MHASIKTAPAVRLRRKALNALKSLEGRDQIEAALVRIATGYGRIESISRRVLSTEYRRPEYVFFINFENAADALQAAHELDGLLYGIPALVVTVPRSGFGRLS